MCFIYLSTKTSIEINIKILNIIGDIFKEFVRKYVLTISTNEKPTTIANIPAYSLLKILLKENGNDDFLNFLKDGIKTGVSDDQFKYFDPNFFSKNLSSAKIILS